MMKRASEVPPVVDRCGVRPVTSAIAPVTRSTNGPCLVRKTSAFEGCQSLGLDRRGSGYVLVNLAELAFRKGDVSEAKSLIAQAKAAAVGDLVPWTEAVAAARRARALLAEEEVVAELRKGRRRPTEGP